MFVISGVNDVFWNQIEFFEYLVSNQYGCLEINVVSEAIDLENLGVYRLLDLFEFKQVVIHTWNPLERHNRYKIKFYGPTYCFDDKTELPYVVSIDKELQVWNKQKIFMCFYGRPSAGRLGISGYLNENYPDQSLIHFSADTNIDSLVKFEFDKLLSYDIDSMVPAANLLKSLPMLQSSRDKYTTKLGYDYKDPLTALYKNILVDVVGETHVLGKTFFPTDKVTRPILLKKPFVSFASKDFNAYLRQMKFRTFSDFWDEDYDGYEGKERYLRILDLIDWIAGHSYDYLETMYWDMQYTLDHNYNLLITKNYNKTITEIF
jgi:hypothetical protein